MKRTLILSIVLIAFSSILLLTAENASTSTACPDGCLSTIVLNTNCFNCPGTWCGPGGTFSFTADARGDLTLGCRCAGTYYFCIGGQTYSVTVDGSANTYYAVQGGMCPCSEN